GKGDVSPGFSLGRDCNRAGLIHGHSQKFPNQSSDSVVMRFPAVDISSCEFSAIGRQRTFQLTIQISVE
ncbi:MAG: hypothetical protein ABI164_09095, partial [Acidobacteriaceae bacterium]